MPKIAALFEPEPEQWGFRGDPYLWREMQERLADTDMPDSRKELREILEQTFEAATGFGVDHTDIIVIDRFKGGGMSSGGISTEFWRSTGIPLLLQRFGAG